MTKCKQVYHFSQIYIFIIHLLCQVNEGNIYEFNVNEGKYEIGTNELRLCDK